MVIYLYEGELGSFHGKKSQETILVMQEVGGDSLSVPGSYGDGHPWGPSAVWGGHGIL